MTPWVLHVDMGQLLAAVEILRHPELAGRPVVVGGKGDPTERAVVSTASYEAREFGIHSGMPLKLAARKCPDAVFLPVDFPVYEAASATVMSTLKTFPGTVVELHRVVVGPTLGTASAVKMCTASLYKGFTALLMQALLTARAYDVTQFVLDDIGGGYCGKLAAAASQIASAAAKSDRSAARCGRSPRPRAMPASAPSCSKRAERSPQEPTLTSNWCCTVAPQRPATRKYPPFSAASSWQPT